MDMFQTPVFSILTLTNPTARKPSERYPHLDKLLSQVSQYATANSANNNLMSQPFIPPPTSNCAGRRIWHPRPRPPRLVHHCSIRSPGADDAARGEGSRRRGGSGLVPHHCAAAAARLRPQGNRASSASQVGGAAPGCRNRCVRWVPSRSRVQV